MTETELLHRLCERLVQTGLALSRAAVISDTLHPTVESRAFRWRNYGIKESSLFECGRTNEGDAAICWQPTTFYHLLQTGGDELRHRMNLAEPAGFTQLDPMKTKGQTDYLAFIHCVSGEGLIGVDGLRLFPLHMTTRAIWR